MVETTSRPERTLVDSMKRAIVTAGVSGNRIFAPYLERFEQTFRQYGGADYLRIWHHEWPPGSPTHGECNYAFKVHAVREAISQGCTSIIWFDSSANAIRPLGPMWTRLERDGHLLVEDANALSKWSSDHSLDTFGITRDQAEHIRLMCGTCWGIDITNERSLQFFERLASYAKPEHFNGTHVSRLPGVPRPGTEGALMSNDPRCAGHRSDEVYMSLIASEMGMVKHVVEEFAGGGGINEKTCVRSGYDLPFQPISPAAFEEQNARVSHRWRTPIVRDPLTVIAEHTIDEGYLSGGFVLDAGCRDFGFARSVAERGCRVIAMDPDPTIEEQKIDGVTFLREALSVNEGERHLVMTSDPQARHLEGRSEGASSSEKVSVQAVSIETIMERFGVKQFDCVKLDIEGGEIGILRAWPGPIAKQISVEFHEHCMPVSQETYDGIFSHLTNWYDVVQHERTARYGAGYNYWDSLFVLREGV